MLAIIFFNTNAFHIGQEEWF